MNPCRSSWLFWLHGLNGAPMFGPPSGTRVPLFVQAAVRKTAAPEIKRREIMFLRGAMLDEFGCLVNLAWQYPWKSVGFERRGYGGARLF
jgi:hypothetical protein